MKAILSLLPFLPFSPFSYYAADPGRLFMLLTWIVQEAHIKRQATVHNCLHDLLPSKGKEYMVRKTQFFTGQTRAAKAGK
jgi:hypothetical protein